MHWFSSDAFLSAVAAVYFPGSAFRPAVYESCGHRFRVLAVEGRPPVVDWPFLDFLVPLSEARGPVEGTARYVPRAALGTIELGGLPSLPAGTEPAPFIRWDRFSGWKAFETHFAARRSSLVRDSRSKRRGLEKTLGPLRFCWEEPRPEVFDACIAWKSAQYVRTGFPDVFWPRRNVDLFRALHARGALVISSLSAGDRLLSVHFGALDASPGTPAPLAEGERMYSWIAAYDPEVGRFSPGRLLLEDMLQESQQRGHSEWDFGLGGMEYKWIYATHTRVVGAVGRQPLAAALGKLASSGVKRALGKSPELLRRARRLRQFLQTLGG
jgi:hypothetical protein